VGTEWAESTAEEKTGQRREKTPPHRAPEGNSSAPKSPLFHRVLAETVLPERQSRPLGVGGATGTVVEHSLSYISMGYNNTLSDEFLGNRGFSKARQAGRCAALQLSRMRGSLQSSGAGTPSKVGYLHSHRLERRAPLRRLNLRGSACRSSDREQPGVHASGARRDHGAGDRKVSGAASSSMGALPENAARKAGAEGAYGRSVISSRRRLQVADGYGFQPPLP
jgi:hypothetical protein